jgi:heme/copper-type cytochrome/quinol oxidase subunit 2
MVIQMPDDIKIHKGLIVLALGLLIALAAAAYVAAPKAGSDAQFTAPSAGTQPAALAQPDQAQPTAQAQPVQPSAPANRGGCGCGGGGLSCGGAGAVQDIYIKALSDGTYDKQELDVRKGETVRLHFTADPSAGCGRSMVVYGLNIRASSLNGEESVVEFIPQQAGSYEISCGMRMWGPAKLVVS